jgi:hypothetical protein
MSMPGTSEVTRPPPLPATATVSVLWATALNLKRPVTTRSWLIVTEVGSVEPVTEPIHESNWLPASARASRLTTVPASKWKITAPTVTVAGAAPPTTIRPVPS